MIHLCGWGWRRAIRLRTVSYFLRIGGKRGRLLGVTLSETDLPRSVVNHENGNANDTKRTHVNYY